MIKEGDILYCHTDVYHTRDKPGGISQIMFKRGNKYVVWDLNESITNDPFFELRTEQGVIFLISVEGTHKCQKRHKFYTIEELREKKLDNIL